MTYTVNTFRKAGLQAKWIREDGRPVIACRDPYRPDSSWAIVDTMMFRSMQSKALGTIKQTFEKWQAFATIQPIREQRTDY